MFQKDTLENLAGEVKTKFLEIIKTNDERNKKLGSNKQEINSAIIYRELIKCGYDVGESTVRQWYRDYKNSLPKEVYIKQSYEYEDCSFKNLMLIKLTFLYVYSEFQSKSLVAFNQSITYQCPLLVWPLNTILLHDAIILPKVLTVLPIILSNSALVIFGFFLIASIIISISDC